MMSSSVRILNLEDNPNDSELIEAMLASDGMDCELVRVETDTDFVSALERGGFQLIISDFTLPSFDGRSALIEAQIKSPDVPFIFFSGTIGEEAAIEAMRMGATDYVLKQRPVRLVTAVKRSLREVEERVARKNAEDELRRIEEQLRQAQKMDAFGQLAGGVAHDFNNLLTIINGYSELLLMKLGPTDDLRSSAEEISKAGERAAGLTGQLLAFSRKQILQPKVLDLNAVVAETEKMLRRVIGENIEVITVLDPKIGHIKADPGQIQQVLLNFAVNSRDAMSQGGKLTIETSNVQVDEAYTHTNIDVRAGSYVMLAVSDTGCGIDASNLPHIFEPFFTTKEPGKGTGLGLSTVYGIVKQSGGDIRASSQVGQGTTFKIYLPLVDEPADTVGPGMSSSALPGGSETVLVVEDEQEVRKLARQILQMHGYRVLEAANGQEAVLKCQQHEGPIHLMLTDVVLPQMSGPKSADKLALLLPEMKVLYMSGYIDDVIAHQGVVDRGTAFIQKPFTANNLLSKVREVLDSHPEG